MARTLALLPLLTGPARAAPTRPLWFVPRKYPSLRFCSCNNKPTI